MRDQGRQNVDFSIVHKIPFFGAALAANYPIQCTSRSSAPQTRKEGRAKIGKRGKEDPSTRKKTLSPLILRGIIGRLITARHFQISNG